MFAKYAVMSMTPQLATLTTELPQALNSKTCPPIGCARFALSIRQTSRNNNYANINAILRLRREKSRLACFSEPKQNDAERRQ